MSETLDPIVVGSTKYNVYSIEGLEYAVLDGYTLEDKEYGYQIKVDPRSNRTFYVNLAGKGSAWKLPDVSKGGAGDGTSSEASGQTSEGNAAGGGTRARGVSNASSASGTVPAHPEELTVGTNTTYILHRIADGSEVVILKGCDLEKHLEFLWSVRYDKRSGRFFYSNQARGERKWALPEIPEDERPTCAQSQQQQENTTPQEQPRTAESQPPAAPVRRPSQVTFAENTAAVVQQQQQQPSASGSRRNSQQLEQQQQQHQQPESVRRQSTGGESVEKYTQQQERAVEPQNNNTNNNGGGANAEEQNNDNQEGEGDGSRVEPPQLTDGTAAVARRTDIQRPQGTYVDAYKVQYHDMLQRNIELQTHLSVVNSQLEQSEGAMQNAQAQHTMEVSGLKKHVEELQQTIERLKTQDCSNCAEKDRQRLQAENALLQGIREHTSDIMKREEEKAKLFAEKSDWHAERLNMKVEIMSLQQKNQYQQEQLELLTGRSQTFDSDMVALKARITALQGEREILNETVRQLRGEVEEAHERENALHGLGANRGGDTSSSVLSLDCCTQTLESWIPRSRPSTEIEREVANLQTSAPDSAGPFAQCCVCNSYRASLLCQDCVNHELQRVRAAVIQANTSPLRIRTAAGSTTQVVPAPASPVNANNSNNNTNSPNLTTGSSSNNNGCNMCELRGAALARQREHISNLEATVARLQVQTLQGSSGARSAHKDPNKGSSVGGGGPTSPSPVTRLNFSGVGTNVKSSSPLGQQQPQHLTSHSIQTGGDYMDVSDQLKDAKMQLKAQRDEIRDLRGLLTKHLSVAPGAGVSRAGSMKGSPLTKSASERISMSPAPSS